MVGGQQNVVIWYFSSSGRTSVAWNFPGQSVDKDAGPLDPLAEDLAPCAFCPTGVRHREVEIIMTQVLPEPCGYDMPERVAMVVEHHLGLSRGTRT